MTDGAIGATFKVTRVLQAACMTAIIGMTSNFISQIVASNSTPPVEVVGTLSVACIAVLYCVITFILYLDNLLPYFVATIIDGLLLIAWIVVAVVLGRPLPFVNCALAAREASLGLTGTSPSLAKITYGEWITIDKSTCLETKSIWGMSIALCILYTLSATTTVCLWKRGGSAAGAAKGEA